MRTSHIFKTPFLSSLFQRGEVALVSKVRADEDPPIFYLQRLDQTDIEGSFYREQLRRLSQYDKRGYVEVNSILDEKIENGEKWYKVNYVGLRPNFQKWVKEADLMK